jgi:hypothetical protein
MAWFQLITVGSCVGVYVAGKILIGSAHYLIDLAKGSSDPQDTRDEFLDSSKTADLQDVTTVENNYPMTVAQESNKNPLVQFQEVREPAAESRADQHPGEDAQGSGLVEIDECYTSDELGLDTIEADRDVNMEIREPQDPDENESVDNSPAPLKLERVRQWFLVKSSTGQVRVCQAWEPTPKTIAGPFPTREEANAAKKQ